MDFYYFCSRFIQYANHRMKPQFLIGSTSSGSGKTVFTMGLLRALRKRGMKSQTYKCGPDFIDTQLHGISADVGSVNLDLWLADKTHLQYSYNKYGEAADVCIVEGNASLFDGYKRMHGSSAEISFLLSLPVLLVVNARSSAYSVAPMLYGYKHFRSDIKILGVVFTNVSSQLHFSYLKDACNDAGLSCLGYIPYDDALRLPSKHSAITQTIRKEIEDVAEKASLYIEKYIDLDLILKSCTRIFPCKYTLPYTSDVEELESNLVNTGKKLRIAVARDGAFNFMYRENLDKLYSLGNIYFFSPLYTKDFPSVDLIYLPGGFPELFARQLYRRKDFLQNLRIFAEKGGKILAEGGAVALLSRTITVRDGGTAYDMSGILPLDCTVKNNGVVAGYRSLLYNGMTFKGYESRYLCVNTGDDANNYDLSCTAIENTRGVDTGTPLYRYKNVVATFTHFYWGGADFFALWD